MRKHTTVVLDLSHSITPDMPVFPGSAQPEIIESSTVAKNGFAERKITLYTHHGTHIDAPAHVITSGRHLGEIPIDHFMGEALCVHVDAAVIGMSTLAACLDNLEGIDFLLFATGWSRYWGTEQYYSGYPVLTREAAGWLADSTLKGVGFDTISADRDGDHALGIHHLLLKKMVLIENLTNLEKLPPTRFHFSCLPLKIEGADGSPVRAVAHWKQLD